MILKLIIPLPQLPFISLMSVLPQCAVQMAMLPHSPSLPLGAGETIEEHLCGALQLYLQFQRSNALF